MCASYDLRSKKSAKSAAKNLTSVPCSVLLTFDPLEKSKTAMASASLTTDETLASDTTTSESGKKTTTDDLGAKPKTTSATKDTAKKSTSAPIVAPVKTVDITSNSTDDEDTSDDDTAAEGTDINLRQLMHTIAVGDTNFSPKPFNGKSDATSWLRSFKKYTQFRQLNNHTRLQLFQLLMTDQAADWLQSLPSATTKVWENLQDAFKGRFALSDIERWQKASTVLSRDQGAKESVDVYITEVQKAARQVPIRDENVIRFAIIRGLKPKIRIHVLQSKAKTMEEVIDAARVAEAALATTVDDSTEISDLTKTVAVLVDRLDSQVTNNNNESIAVLSSRAASNQQQSPTKTTRQQDQPKRFNFQGPQQYREQNYGNNQQQSYGQNSYNTFQHQQSRNGTFNNRRHSRGRGYQNAMPSQRSNNGRDGNCTRCGTTHNAVIATMLRAILYLFLFVSATEAATGKVTPSFTLERSNLGVIMKSYQTISLIDSVWHHTFELQLPHREGRKKRLSVKSEEKWQPMTTLQQQENGNTTFEYDKPCKYGAQNDTSEDQKEFQCLANPRIRESIRILRLKQIRHAKDIIDSIYDIIEAVEIRSRVARSWCKFCTNVFSAVTGLASDDTVTEVKSNVKALQENVDLALNEFQQTTDGLRSYMKLSEDRFTVLQNMVEKEIEMSRISVVAETREIAELKYDASLITAAISYTTEYAEHLIMLNGLKLELQMLMNGYISEDFLPVKRLQKVLDNIQKQLNKGNMQRYLARSKAKDYYSLGQYSISRVDNKLYINLAIPLTAFKSEFVLYKIEAYEVPVDGQANLTTTLTNLPQFIAYSESEDYFIEFDTIKPELESTDLYYLTQNSQILKNRKAPTCASAIIEQNTSAIHDRCKTALTQPAVAALVKSVSPNRLLIRGLKSYRVICGTNSTDLMGSDALTVMNIPPGCTFESQDKSLMYVGSLGSRFDTEITVLHSVNLAVLARFFNASVLAAVKPDKYFAVKPEIVIPQLEAFSADYAKDLAFLQQNTFDLDKIINSSISESKIFTSISHKIMADMERKVVEVYSSSQFGQNWQIWLLAAAAGASMIALAGLGIVYFKLRNLTTVFILMQKASGARVAAQEIIPFTLNYFNIRPTATDVTESIISSTLPELKLAAEIQVLDIALFSFCLGVAALLLYRIYQYLFPDHDFELKMEIGNKRERITLSIMKCPHDPEFYEFTASKFLSSVKIDGAFSKYLEIEWPELMIKHKFVELTFNLPQRVRVTWLQSVKIKRILQTSYYALLFHTNKKHPWNLIPLSESKWEHIEPTCPANVQLQMDSNNAIKLYPSLPSVDT